VGDVWRGPHVAPGRDVTIELIQPQAGEAYELREHFEARRSWPRASATPT